MTRPTVCRICSVVAIIRPQYKTVNSFI